MKSVLNKLRGYRERLEHRFGKRVEQGEHVVHIVLYGALALGQHETYAHLAGPVVVVLVLRVLL